MVYTPTGDANINTLGAVPIFVNEDPCIFTARVIATISGGQFAMVSGTGGAVVGSSALSYTANDLVAAPALLYDNVGGLALYNVASGTNNYVALARKGAFLVQATDVVSGGHPVVFASGGVADIFSANAGSASIPGAGQFYPLGRALTCGDSGGYALVALNL